MTLVQIYEVSYPDERRGPDGRSSALFRLRLEAERFAMDNQGKVKPIWVGRGEIRRLIAQGKLASR